MGRKLIIIFSVFGIAFSAVGNDSFGRAGVFLSMPVGWKQIAMGGCGVATGGEASSGWYNPAALQLYRGWGGSSGYSRLALDRWFYHISAAGNIRNDAAVALSWVHADAGEIYGRDIDGNYTEELAYGEDAIFLTFAKVVTRELTVGANVKYVQAKLSELSTYIAGFDIGAHGRLFNNQLLLGLSYCNISMKYQWDSADLYGKNEGTSCDETLPGQIRVGAAYEPENLPGVVTAEIGYSEPSGMRFRGGISASFYEIAEVAVGFDDGLFAAGFGVEYVISPITVGFGYAFRLERESLPPRHSFDIIIKTK